MHAGDYFTLGKIPPQALTAGLKAASGTQFLGVSADGHVEVAPKIVGEMQSFNVYRSVLSGDALAQAFH
jgi:hypothetical protein